MALLLVKEMKAYTTIHQLSVVTLKTDAILDDNKTNVVIANDQL